MILFCIGCVECLFFFFFKQKTAYEMRISDWSSDVCSSDLIGLYHWIFYVELVIERAGDPHLMDIVVGTVSIALVFLAGHVMMGASLPLICDAFLLYGLYGHYLPAPLGHCPSDSEQNIAVLFPGTAATFGTPTHASSTY